MRNQKVLKILLLYNVLDIVYRVAQASDSRTHAFVHVDGDLRYLMDGVSMEMKEFIREEDTSAVSFTDLNEENLNAYASPIAFHPPMLNFYHHPVGMPQMERITVQNLSPDTSIHMLSISGNTLHTHCSFFQEKIIPPGGNTSFDVVLLARDEGIVEDTLFIHTSLGSFKFQVSAVGIPNPYRLRPFVGVKMPLNSSYTPIIYMHNPHGTSLQINEMYSSGGDLHLELPDGESDAPQSLWEIPPYETKPVIKANFIARTEKNHTAFIRIRTNCSRLNYLLLPVEVDVTSVPGIYCPTEILDFGFLRSQDEAKVLTLSLLNSGQKHVHIVNVIATPVNEAVDVKFVPAKIPPDTVFSTQIATITFNPSRAFHSKQCCGKIVIKSKNNQYKLQIPYQVKLLKGSLDYNKNCTRFYVGHQNSSNFREFNITNNFNVVIIVFRVSLPAEAKEHFLVKFVDAVVLKPAQSATVAFLSFKPSFPDLQLTSYLRVHTNISHFDIPLLCFTGRLKIFLPHAINESFIDFGTLGMGDKRTVIFAVINENPVDVNLKFWSSNASKSYVELVGVDKGNASTLAWRQNFSAMARSLILKPQHYAIFRIGITAPNYEGLFQGQAFVETQYEKINIPFSLRTAKGSLRVSEVFFENSFPGKISSQSLHILSTFSHSMTITSITTVPEDTRFIFDLLKRGSPVLHPNSRTMVGKIHFDHRKYCKQKCYSGLPTTTTMGYQWLLGMALPSDIGNMDKDLFRTLSKRWHSLLDLEERTTNITLRIDTTEVRGYLLKAHASLQWPRMVSRCKLKFPITQIGNRTVKDFTLENPSSLPVLVQILPVSLYPNPTNIINTLKEKYVEDFGHTTIIKETDVFTLEDLEENNPNPDNHIPAYRKSLEEYFGIISHKKSIAMLLTPGMRVRIQVGFTPKDDIVKSSLIIIRNNLTVMDAVLVHGQGGYGQIKFGNISPGTDSLLMFELTERLLKDCDSSHSSKYIPHNLSVRRAFTARNTGALPIYVKGFDINGKVCQGYGFRLLNCQGFELKPNSSKKIDIAFTPDFSLTRVQRTLNVRTSQGPDGQILQYTLLATIPKHMLSFCSKSLPRPYWESYAFFIFLILSLFMIFSVIVCGYLDGQHLLHNTFFPFITVGIHAEKVETDEVFDLNAMCSAPVENNNFVKTDDEIESMKKKENILEKISVSENNSVLNSMRNGGTSLSKQNDLLNSKEFDDQFNENNKNFKKRSPKLKSYIENYYLESDLIEIKKSQPRNSWTRFLKPPFSFHSCSNINNKPSVATQTISNTAVDDSFKTLKELDIISDQNINCFFNIENNPHFKPKIKNESKYGEEKFCPRKMSDSLLEEETSSTTTETSTTESDMSEKDHRLPDVCVTSKPQKFKFSKNKTKFSNSPYLNNRLSKSLESIIDENFDMNSYIRIRKKNRVDSKNREVGCPNLLELPYKLKPVPEDESKLIEISFKNNTSRIKIKDDLNVVECSQNLARQREFYNYIMGNSPEKFIYLSCDSSTKYPSTYSAALSKDVLCNNREKNIVFCEVQKKFSDSLKLSSSKSKHNQNNSSFVKNSHNQSSVFHNSLDTEKSESFCSDVQDKLSGSKLKCCWMLESRKHKIPLKNTPDVVNEDSLVLNNRSFSKKNDNWPGFDLTPVRESFWDNNYNPNSESWNNKPTSGPLKIDINGAITSLPNLSPNMWDSSIPSSSWEPDELSWSSSCDNGSSVGDNGMNLDASVAGEFDPFHTPSALWIPLLNDKEKFSDSSGSSTWSYSLFSEPPQVVLSESTCDFRYETK